jgi:hypothetical protein
VRSQVVETQQPPPLTKKTTSLWERFTSFLSRKSPIKALKVGYINAFQKKFDGQRFLAVKGASPFERELAKFSSSLMQLAKDPEQMRAKIVKLSQDLEYRKLLTSKPNHHAVIFLQECGMRLESTQATSVFANYGKTRTQFDEGQKDVSFLKFAETIRKARKQMPNVQNGWKDKLIWALKNPGKALHMLYGRIRPLVFDSYQGHAVFHSAGFSDCGQKITHKYSPGLTGSGSIVERVLIPAYRRNNQRWVHIDNQSTHMPSERERINEVHRWSQENPGVFIQAVISTKTPVKVAEAVISKFIHGTQAPKDFIKEYEGVIRGTEDRWIRNFNQMRGIYIPDELLDKNELEAAFACARNMICKASLEDYLHTSEGRKKLVRIIHSNLTSVLSWAIMKKEQLNRKNSTFTEGCKENIDRGPPENMGVVVNDLLARGEKMSVETAQLQAGILLGRGEYAMDRSPNASKIEPLLERLEFIEKSNKVVREELSNLRNIFQTTDL